MRSVYLGTSLAVMGMLAKSSLSCPPPPPQAAPCLSPIKNCRPADVYVYLYLHVYMYIHACVCANVCICAFTSLSYHLFMYSVLYIVVHHIIGCIS